MADVIKVGVGITKNMGNFNSVRLDAAVEIEVKPGETRDEVWTKAWEEVDVQLEAKIKEVNDESDD